MSQTRHRRWASAAVVSVLPGTLLVGCGAPLDRRADVPSGPVRVHWQLGHRVPSASGVRVVGRRLDDYSDSTQVSFGKQGGAAEVLCTVTVYVAGSYGPQDKVGEQLPTTVRGRPAVRNGAGAEGDYLMWQRADGTWAESTCEQDGQRRFQDRLAAIVTTEPSSLVLPFDAASLPPGLRVTSIDSDLRSGETNVRLDATASDRDRAQGELVLSYDAELNRQAGRATVIAGHPASLDETPTSPGLCLAVQGHEVCVGAGSSDTGPYPDRSAELPVMVAIAEGLRFPARLDDRSSWYPAEKVFG